MMAGWEGSVPAPGVLLEKNSALAAPACTLFHG